MDAREEGWRRTSFEMFPMVRYTGQASLSPLNLDSCVLSDARITGQTVEPLLSFFYQGMSIHYQTRQACMTYLYVPPPLCRPHLSVLPIQALVVDQLAIDSNRLIALLSIECWVAEKLAYALDWIALPKLQGLDMVVSLSLAIEHGSLD